MGEVIGNISEQPIEQSMQLDERAALAKGSMDQMERLIEDFTVFLRARVYRYASKSNETQREEMYGTAMLAFYESVQKYDGEKGHFFGRGLDMERNEC